MPYNATQRPSGRAAHTLREVRITRHYTRHAEGSVLIEFGDTRVLCNASVDEKVPPFLRGQGKGTGGHQCEGKCRNAHRRLLRVLQPTGLLKNKAY